MRNKIFFIITGLIIINLVLLIFCVRQKPVKDGMEVIFFDVGQGDASLIMAQGGVNVLIDGGPDKKVVKKLDKYLPLWNRKIDIMVLTHPHSDHVLGFIDVLKKYPVREIWMTGVLHNSSEYLIFLGLVRDKKIAVKILKDENSALPEYEIAPNTKIKILYPRKSFLKQKIKNLNNSSIVLEAVYKNKIFLFTGDIENEAENELRKEKPYPGHLLKEEGVLKADVLKVAHHGSDNSSSHDFLDLVKPKIAVISVGKDNEFGLPSLRVIKRLERIGSRVLRTDEAGDVIMKVEGDVLSVFD